MSHPHAQPEPSADVRSSERTPSILRIDPAHPLRPAPPPVRDTPPETEPDESSLPLESPLFESPELAGLQAEQLAHWLRQRERELDRREAAVHARLADLDHRLRCERLRQAAADRPPADDDLRHLAHPQLACLEAERQQLAREQEQVWQDLARRRDQFADERRAWEERLADRRRSLEEQRAALQQRHVALETLQAEVFALHGRTLETRLAVEEVWAEISQSTPPEQRAARIAESRRRLAEHDQWVERLQEQRLREMRGLAERLTRQRDQLAAEHQALEQWAARREAEVEQQAARLVAREHELDRRERLLRDQQLAWTRRQRELQGSEPPPNNRV